MNKLTIGAAALVLTGAAAAAAFPWYVGWKAEQRFAAEVSENAANQNSPVTVTLVTYRRGWLNSSATHRVALKIDPTVYFDVNHSVRHVPDPTRGFVVIESTPKWPKEVQAAADYYFGSKPAFAVQTVVRFDRSLGMTVESPAFSKPMLAQPSMKLTWGGATGTVSVHGGSKMDMALDLPRIALEGGGVTAEFAGMQVRGDWVVAGNQADWSGRTDLGVREISFNSPFGNGSLKGVETSVVQRNKGETVLVGYTLKVREGAAQSSSERPHAFRNAVLDVEFDRLDRKALAKYFDDVAGADQAQLAPDAYNHLVGHIALGMFGDLLKGSPEMRLKQVAVQTENGHMSGSAVLAFNGKGFAVQSGVPAHPAELLSRVKFTGSAELSTSLLQAWMAGDAREQALSVLTAQGASFEESQLQSLAQEMVHQQLAALEATGLLKAEGDKFVIRAEYDAGALTVNGVRNDQFLPPLVAPSGAPAGDDDRQV
jgi:uncharacterized protein YdgA (DUF945 family)